MVYYVEQRGKASVMIEAAYGACEKAPQRRGAIELVRGTIGLKSVDSDFGWRVQVPTGFGENRRNVARGALCFG
jgi:hypothetical protein